MRTAKTFFKDMFVLWAPVVVWMMFIFSVSGIPHLKTPFGIWDFILRKLAHITEYFILSFLVFRAMSGTWSTWGDQLLMALTCFIGFLYAVSDEFHQSFVPGRWGSVLDVLVDCCGIMIFVLIYGRIKTLNGARSDKHENQE